MTDERQIAVMAHIDQDPIFRELIEDFRFLESYTCTYFERLDQPSRLKTLYELCTKSLLESWERESLKEKLTPEKMLALAQKLAAHLMRTERNRISKKDALKVLRPLTDEEFEALVQGSGLFRVSEANEDCSFRTRAHQICLAAGYFASEQQPDISALVDRPEWHHCLRLYAALSGNVSAIIKAALEDPTPRSLELAARVRNLATEADKISPTHLRKLDACLAEDQGTEEGAQRYGLCALLQLLRSGQAVEIQGQYRRVSGWVTVGMFQPFVDKAARSRPRVYLQPEHWPGSRLPGSASHPLRGVAPDAAKKFCEWASNELGIKIELATVDELRLAGEWPTPADGKPLGSWCRLGEQIAMEGLSATDVRSMKQALYLGCELHLPPPSNFLMLLSQDVERGLDRLLGNTSYLMEQISLACEVNLGEALRLAKELQTNRDIPSEMTNLIKRARAMNAAASDGALYRQGFLRDQKVALALVSVCGWRDVEDLIKTEAYDGALDRLARLQEEHRRDPAWYRRAVTLAALCELLKAGMGSAPHANWLAIRGQARQYLARLFELILLGLRYRTNSPKKMLTRVSMELIWLAGRLLQMISRQERTRIELDLELLYTYFQVLVAREKSPSRAWEGIRVSIPDKL